MKAHTKDHMSNIFVLLSCAEAWLSHIKYFVFDLKYDLNLLITRLKNNLLPKRKRGLSALQNLPVSSASAPSNNY